VAFCFFVWKVCDSSEARQVWQWAIHKEKPCGKQWFRCSRLQCQNVCEWQAYSVGSVNVWHSSAQSHKTSLSETVNLASRIENSYLKPIMFPVADKSRHAKLACAMWVNVLFPNPLSTIAFQDTAKNCKTSPLKMYFHSIEMVCLTWEQFEWPVLRSALTSATETLAKWIMPCEWKSEKNVQTALKRKLVSRSCSKPATTVRWALLMWPSKSRSNALEWKRRCELCVIPDARQC